MRAEEIKGLMEAYSQVYETPEVLNEEVETSSETCLSENTNDGIGSAYSKSAQAQLRQRSRNIQARGGGFGQIGRGLTRMFGSGKQIAKLDAEDKADRAREQTALKRSKDPNWKPAAVTPAAKPAATPVDKPAATPVAKPAATPVAKPAATATSKPTTPAAPAKPAGSAMDQWAAANPKLAAAKAERDRTRGTSATTNPLMKDMKSSMPAPKSPAPSTASTGFGLAKKGVNLAAGVDIFDLVKGHLLDEGYADSEEGAMVIMVNMSEEWRKSILESYGVELDEAASSRREGESESEFVMRRRTEYMRPRRGPEHETERTSYSPKRARAGEDIGKPGKMFGKIAKEAGERYGSEEKGKKVAGAVLAKLRKEEVDKIEEAVKGESSRRREDLAIERRSGIKPLSTKKGEEYGKYHKDQIDYVNRKKEVTKEDLEAWVDELIAEGYDLSEYTWEEVAEIYAQELELVDEGKSSRPRYPGGRGVLDQETRDEKREAHAENRKGHTAGPGTVTKNTKKLRKQKAMGEIGEEYMDEAQRARENPEDHDEKEKRKYEPVRGERTPMPPRGDKRREEFEKWYAKQMGR